MEYYPTFSHPQCRKNKKKKTHTHTHINYEFKTLRAKAPLVWTENSKEEGKYLGKMKCCEENKGAKEKNLPSE